MRIDSHQHYWSYSREAYPWIGEGMEVLAETHEPPHLDPVLAAHSFEGSVVVQARSEVEETRYLISLAKRHASVLGVVGWVDLTSDDVAVQLEEFDGEERLKGMRWIVQDEPDDRFMDRADFRRGLRASFDRGYVYDILVYARQLPAAVDLAAAFPDDPFVLDHIAKPEVKAGAIDEWALNMRALAARENVCCKVSGMVTEADWSTWTPEDFAPYLDVVLEAFGPSRLMYGSDWPVCRLAAEYDRVLELAESFAARLSDNEKAAFFGGNASRFYGV